MIFKLVNPVARASAHLALNATPDGWVVRITEATRSLDQNAKLWSLLADISEQVVWHGMKLTAYDWKDIFTASLKKARVVPGIDGGFVVCGLSSSKLSKSEFSELIDLIQAFGADREVKWTEHDVPQ